MVYIGQNFANSEDEYGTLVKNCKMWWHFHSTPDVLFTCLLRLSLILVNNAHDHYIDKSISHHATTYIYVFHFNIKSSLSNLGWPLDETMKLPLWKEWLPVKSLHNWTTSWCVRSLWPFRVRNTNWMVHNSDSRYPYHFSDWTLILLNSPLLQMQIK